MEKLVSIIIPCFNVEKYIDRCLLSIVRQTIGVDHLEIIIVDDASTDMTWTKLMGWEKKYPDSIILIQQEENQKQGAARNKGLCYVTSPYVCFIDADDSIAITMIEKLYDKITELEVDAVGCNYCHIVNEKDIVPTKTGPGMLYDYSQVEQKKLLVLNGCPGYVWGKLYHSEYIQKYQIFFPEQCYYEDLDWKDQFCLHLHRYYQVQEKLYYYFANPNSTTMQTTCKRHFDRFFIEFTRLERYQKLGIFETYKDELEYHFIRSFYINTLYIFLSRCEDFTPNILQYM